MAIQLFSRMNSRAKHCERKAKECERIAQQNANLPLQPLYLKIAQQWRVRARQVETRDRIRAKS